MAQHYKVDLEKEIEVKKSLERIGKYIYSSKWLIHKLATRMANNQPLPSQLIYTKEVQFLPKDYYEKGDSFVIIIKPYDLKRTKKCWGEYWVHACLECHFGIIGNLKKVYYPL